MCTLSNQPPPAFRHPPHTSTFNPAPSITPSACNPASSSIPAPITSPAPNSVSAPNTTRFQPSTQHSSTQQQALAIQHPTTFQQPTHPALSTQHPAFRPNTPLAFNLESSLPAPITKHFQPRTQHSLLGLAVCSVEEVELPQAARRHKPPGPGHHHHEVVPFLSHNGALFTAVL